MKTNYVLRYMLMIISILIIQITPSYAQLAKCKGKYFGNIIAGSVRSDYTTYWNQVTSENGSKWGSVEGTQGVYNFGNSDLAYNWAKNNGGLFKYHNLIWGAQTPGWVGTASTAVITAAIDPYFKAVQQHYASMGGIKMIDVLNEPVNTAMPGNLKAALTAGYKAEPANAGDLNNQYGWAIWCFQLARKYFPNATLLINEYNIEMNWNNCRAPYIAMVQAIKNAPNLTDGQKNLIDGVGLQAHGVDNLTAANFKACIDEIWTKTGVPVHITEFDQAANPNEAKQQSVYSTLIPVAWEHPHVAGITLWGYVQGSTWINGNGVSGSGGTDSGILYANGTERPAFTWLKQYLASQTSLACCPAPAPFGTCTGTTNTPPTVSITSPANNATFTAPGTITINATAADVDGTVSGVQFYNGTTLLVTDATSPYSFVWSGVAAGTYSITAKATDNSSAVTSSTAITVVVNAANVTPTGVTTYVNPIQPGDHPDQTLLRVGNDFYSTGSSFHFTPYVPILHSTDLVHWEVISRVVPSNWSGLAGDGTGQGIWEGALAYFNNKYWVYYSNTAGGGQYFSNATSPAGPWSAPTKVTSPTVTGYDNSIFVDDDGTPYMLMKNGQSINRIQQVDPTTGQLTGTLLNLDWVNANNRYSWAEGPVMVKRNGRYYYIFAGDVSGGQYVISSPTLTATESSWTLHGNFFTTGNSAGGFTGPNHASQPVKLDDGTWWCVSHAYDNSGWRGQGRLGLLHQVTWDANGVPHGAAPSINPVTAPNLPNNKILLNLPKADYFTSTTLNLNWHFFNKTNATTYSLTANPGNLRLTPGTGTTHILQKEGGHYYSLVTKVNVNATANGNQAGLRIMNGKDDLFATLYSGFSNGSKKIGFAFNGTATEVANTIGNTVWLKIERELHNIKGFYSADGKTWTQVGSAINVSTLDDYNTNWNEWVGTSIGLYATGVSSDFDLFKYRDGFSANKIAGYNNFNGVSTATKTPGATVTNTASDGWLLLGGVDLGQDGTSSSSVEVNAASAAGGGSLEIWLDDIGGNGSKIATLPITSSGGNDTWQNYTTNLTASGLHDVYLKFIGSAGVFSLNTIRFLSATVVANIAPTVTITSPINNTGFTSLATVTITATASDADGTVTGVQFYNGTTLLATDATAPYSFVWGNVAAGAYSITAIVTDNRGGTATSTGVNITVTLPVNQLPTVSLTSPANNATFTSLATVTITATASDADGTVTGVQFYNGTTLLATDATAPYSYVWGNVAAGSYSITAIATDNRGGTATSTGVNITVTLPVNQLPVVSLTSPANNATYTSLATVTITATASDADGTVTGVQFYNGTTLLATDATAPYSFVWNNVATGSYSITAIATDNRGGTATSTGVNITVTLPVNQLPTVSLTSPANNATFTSLATVTITATASDADGTVTGVQFYNGTTLLATDATAPYSFVWTNVAAGAYSITAIATNNRGGTATSTGVNITVTLPVNQLPVVSLTSPANNATFTSLATVTITATASDADGTVTGVQFYNGTTLLATDATAPYSFVWNNVATGSYSITAIATDNRGGTATSTGVNITVALPVNQLPTVSLTSPTNNATYTSLATVTITATASDVDGTVTGVQFYNGTTLLATDATAPYSFVWGNVAAGSYSITAVATDNRGGTATSTGVNITVTLPINQLPTVSLTSPANNATYTSLATVTITATASDADGTVTGVQFYNGTTLLATDATAPYSFVWTNVAAGAYSITAIATDNRGGTATSTGVNITVTPPVNQAPTVSITAPANNASFVTPASVTIAATASDVDGTVTGVQFYNGTTLLGTDATSPFSFAWTGVAAGTYVITAVALDNSGATTTSTAVNITVTVPANVAPTVSITAPSANASFTAPVTITITAFASDADGTVSSVQFFNGTTLLGTAITAPYSFAWAAGAAGTYVITAKATDNSGAVTTSAAITITVTSVVTSIESDITGPDCGSRNGSGSFALLPANKVNATNYNWWYSGSIQNIVPVTGDPTKITINYGNYFSAGQVCVGVNYNVSPWYKQYCKSISTCNGRIDGSDVVTSWESALTIAPNPTPSEFSVTVPQDVHSYHIVNNLGVVEMVGTSLYAGQTIQLGDQLPTGIYILNIQYANGKSESKKLQKIK